MFSLQIRSVNDVKYNYANMEVQPLDGQHSDMYAIAKLNITRNKIELFMNDVNNQATAGVICYKYIECFVTVAKVSSVNTYLSTDYSGITKKNIANLRKVFDNFDLVNSYKAVFSSLWYGALTCTGVVGISGQLSSSTDKYAIDNRLDRSFLKFCSWKGIPIECAAIFTTFPTDLGVCCAFNMKPAEEIYKGKTYANIIKGLQEFEKNYSVSDPSLPNWYSYSGEPKTLAGKNKGLFVMLDSHSDLLANASLDQDYTSFYGLISYKGSFPYMAQEGIEIKPGHHNIISLTALRVDADDTMHDLNPDSRKCRFYDESSILNIYKNYTYANCMFECSLLKAKQQYQCVPWYFPYTDDKIQICSPWVTKGFLDFMNNITAESCSNCLSECSSTIYDASITAFPFRKCDIANMEMSLLCNFSMHWEKPLPKKYSSQLLSTTSLADPQSIWTNSTINIRNYDPSVRNIFINNPKYYDAFETDIATVNVYFRKSSVLQMSSQSKMNWIDYLATVGGLLGLVLGMGFVSFIEIVWFLLRVIARSLHLTRWIK